MTGALILFFGSLILMVALILSHRIFTRGSDLFKRSDAFIFRWLKNGKIFISFFNKKTLKLFFHFVVEEIEVLSEKVFRRLKGFVRKP